MRMRHFGLLLLAFCFIASTLSAPPIITTTSKTIQSETRGSEINAVIEEMAEAIGFVYEGMFLQSTKVPTHNDGSIGNSFRSEDVHHSNGQTQLIKLFEFWPNLLKNLESDESSSESKENSHGSYYAGMEEETKKLHDKLLESVDVYKTKYEPIVEHLHHKAESLLHKIADGDPEVETLEIILNATQQMRESTEAFLALISQK